MANEFIARKGLIVPSGSILVGTGSITASNFLGTASIAVSSSHATTASFALNAVGSGFPFSGSAVITGSLDVTQAVTASFFKGDGSQLTNLPSATVPAGTVSSSTQVASLLPDGTVSSSAQYPGWVTASSQIDVFTTIGGTTLATTGSNTFVGNQIISGAIGIGIVPTDRKLDIDGGEVRIGQSASGTGAWLSVNLTNNTTASAAARLSLRSSASDLEAIPTTQPNLILSRGSDTLGTLVKFTNQRSGFAGIGAIATADNLHNLRFYAGSGSEYMRLAPTDSATLHVQGNVSASSFTGSFQGNGSQLTNISNSALPAGIVSSSAQVKPLLPVGTVTSSAQYPGWVTSSAQIDYNSIQNKLSGVVSSSAQVQPLLPANTVSSSAQVKTFLPVGTVTSSAQYPGWVTASSQIDYNLIQNKLSGVVSSSVQVQPLLPAGTVSSSGQVDYNSIQNKLSGVVSSSAQVKPLLPVGTVTSSAQFPGWVTASSQIDYNNIQNKLSGVVSSSAQVQPLLPAGTVSSSGQVTITATTGYATFSSSISTVDTQQTLRIDNLASLTSSYAINSTIQSQLAGVVSSSAQVKPLLPGGTVTSSAQYPGWVTASSQIDYNSIQNKLSGVVSSSAQVVPLLPNGTVSSSGQVTITATTGYSTFSSSISTVDTEQTLRINNLASLTSSYAINSTIQSQLAGVVSSSTQIKPLLPGGTVTSSAQFPGWVTSSAQIDYNSIQNKLSGVVSSSAQVKPLLPGGTVSSSAQVDYNSIQNKLSGVVSSSTQVQPLLPGGTVSSSAQVAINSTTGTLNVNKGGTGQTSYVNGELLIGNTTGNTLSKATLTGTANRILITNGAGSITINADADSANTVNKIVARDASGNFAGGTITANTLIVGTQAAKATISYVTNTARTLTIPNVAGNRTFAFIDQAQTFSAAQTFSSTPLTLSAATAVLTFSSATGNKTISTAANTNLILSPGGTGNVGVNTTSPAYKLEVNGSFAATTKSFIIDHQELYGKKLVYGVLEGPEHAVYVRGKLTNTSIIQLPDEWSWLVDMDSITVQLTPIGKHQQLYVDHIGDDYIVVKNSAMFDKSVTCYYLIHATRKDVEPLQTVV